MAQRLPEAHRPAPPEMLRRCAPEGNRGGGDTENWETEMSTRAKESSRQDSFERRFFSLGRQALLVGATHQRSSPITPPSQAAGGHAC